MEAELVCLGEALVDLFAADGRRGPLEEVETFRRYLGGAPANVAAAAARLGMRSAMIGCVGDDAFGRFLIRALEREGVDCQGIVCCEQRTPAAFVSLSEGGERSFLFFRENTADTYLDAAVVRAQRGRVAAAKTLHLCTTSMSAGPATAGTKEAVAIAAACGVDVAVDLNLRLHLWEDRDSAIDAARFLVERATFVKADQQEAAELTSVEDPRQAARALIGIGARIAVVTCGSAGAHWATSRESGYQPAPSVDVVDATGAGDVFCAAFYFTVGRLREATAQAVDRAVAAGCNAGAQACTACGAVTAAPTVDQLPSA
ncbi:MAG: carbohydrate kinase [Deltaproteobacteria bacterium]|nr:carbohydrate kinase [Deltaproteobacteria bacterium]